MGNCCDSRGTTDNESENFIREIILTLKLRKYNLEEAEQIITEHIDVSLLDIENNPLKWITKEKYDKLMENHFIEIDNKNINEIQKLACIIYNDILSTGDKNFHFTLLMWLLSQLKSASFNKDDKIKLIQQIILKSDKILTFNTFGKFLRNYLEIILIKITHNFIDCMEINSSDEKRKSYQQLITQVYNKVNLEIYYKRLMDKMNKIVINRRSMLLGKDISNEYLKEIQISTFFKENEFLLDMVEVRHNFFSLYSTNFINYMYND
jgi:hypothetical protein